MIPKQIHYIWLGSKIPNRVSLLMRKSKNFLGGYRFILWQESDIKHLPPFAAYAYGKKCWAFVSDYLRFKILYENGGVYLDTDMEILRPIDDLLVHDGFAGLNKDKDFIYCGIIGSIPQHPLIKKILDVYEMLPQGRYPTSPEIFTKVFKEYTNADFNLYEYNFFYPVQAGQTKTLDLFLDAYATHHWDESWRSFVWIRRVLRCFGLIDYYHKIKKFFKRSKA